ncbi:hypothetical protein SpAn4DRAFT_0861 [Sporomusa ovata]|uniref:Uncharacterized protein n=1 Tax=Sporomusa ovata TaxID=2378 RepID=A0A0U1L526_9FIRM|nr:hypothetical protein SpAn4DRAFT_0861 [Sporomusa ovata]
MLLGAILVLLRSMYAGADFVIIPGKTQPTMIINNILSEI